MYQLSDTDIERIANRTADILYWKLSNPVTKWISQRQAFKLYGEANTRRLLSDGKLAVRKSGNRIEYHVADLEKYAKPIEIVKRNKKVS
ncbi:MAG: hypothetical protein ACK5KP_04490 [Paludibacteraceae bacterium]